MPITDEEAAEAAVSALAEHSPRQQDAKISIDKLVFGDDNDPFVDIHQLFQLYDALYFRSLLRKANVELSWSERLTVCAGMCELIKDSTGEFSRIRVKLSEPILKFRTRSDTVNTLLHECIHAYFFVTSAYGHIRDPTGGHNDGFHRLASMINNHGGYHITEFHNFHDEVDSYRTHIWRCDGPCTLKPPHYGLVKRSMNRPPGKGDVWWEKHQLECGGTYVKISEPELTKKQIAALSAKDRAGRQKNKIDSWVTRKDTPVDHVQVVAESSSTNLRRRRSSSELEIDLGSPKKQLCVACPICDRKVLEREINEHLDAEHPA